MTKLSTLQRINVHQYDLSNIKVLRQVIISPKSSPTAQNLFRLCSYYHYVILYVPLKSLPVFSILTSDLIYPARKDSSSYFSQ